MIAPRPISAAGVSERRYYRLTLPEGMPLINANSRMHNRQRARLTRDLRDAAQLACRTDEHMSRAIRTAHPHPVLDIAWIVGVIHPRRGGRIDPANWYGSFKAAIDGLVLAGVLADDDDLHLIGPDMRRGPVVPGSQITLHIYEASPSDRWTEPQDVTP